MATSTLRRQGPRERMLAHGPACLSTPELLGIVLRTGTRERNAVELGQMLLDHFNGLKGLLSADASALRQLDGIGPAKCAELLVIRELQRRCALESLTDLPVLNQADKVREYCLAHIGHLPVEHCLALFLDNQLRLICAEEISRGTVNQASVYPREILRAALRQAPKVILVGEMRDLETTALARSNIQRPYIRFQMKRPSGRLAVEFDGITKHDLVAGTTTLVDTAAGYQKAREILEGWMPETEILFVLSPGESSIHFSAEQIARFARWEDQERRLGTFVVPLGDEDLPAGLTVARRGPGQGARRPAQEEGGPQALRPDQTGFSGGL